MEINCPFTTFSRYPAAPKPDNTSKSFQDQFFPKYNPYAVNNDVTPKINKNAGPIRYIPPKGSNRLKA